MNVSAAASTALPAASDVVPAVPAFAATAALNVVSRSIVPYEEPKSTVCAAPVVVAAAVEVASFAALAPVDHSSSLPVASPAASTSSFSWYVPSATDVASAEVLAFTVLSDCQVILPATAAALDDDFRPVRTLVPW